MLFDPAISWIGRPSSLDGIESPNVEIFRNDSYALRCVVSEWRDGDCTRASGVEFDDPLVVISSDEMIYSIASGVNNGRGYDGQTYLKEARSSALLDAVVAADPNERRVQHYLLVGLSICVEVVSVSGVEVIDHPSYETATSWAARDAA